MLLGQEPVQQHRKRRSPTAVEKYMNKVLRSEDALPQKLRGNIIRRQNLHEAFSAPVVTMVGPPGTGKTFTCTNLLLHMIEQIFAEIKPVKEKKEAVSSLHCAWNRCAAKVMLDRFIQEIDFADIESGELVIIYVGNDKEISLTPHQKRCVKLLELKGKQQDQWNHLWTISARIHVFVTVGRSHMPAIKYFAIKSWSHPFYVCHMDEASQAMLAFAIHTLRFLRHDGKLLLSGDNRQLAGFSHIQWQNCSVMRSVMAVASPYFLDRQHRQRPGLSALTSALFYEGRVFDAERVLVADAEDANAQRQFAVVVWSNWIAPDVEAYPSETEALLAASLWRALGWNEACGDEYKIMSFYRSQQKSIAQLLSRKQDSVSVDSAQGSDFQGAILSAGRNWCTQRSLGFLHDRRRINVAFSRCKKKLIILLHNDVGKYTKSKPQKCWHSIRQVARRLKCELNIDEVTRANLPGVVDQIKNFTTESNALTSRQVYQEFGDLAGFFNGYQLDRVGGLDEKMALPEDSDAEGCEETVKEGLSENYEEETSSAGDDIPGIIDTSSDDAILPANVSQQLTMSRDTCLKTNFATSP